MSQILVIYLSYYLNFVSYLFHYNYLTFNWYILVENKISHADVFRRNTTYKISQKHLSWNPFFQQALRLLEEKKLHIGFQSNISVTNCILLILICEN